MTAHLHERAPTGQKEPSPGQNEHSERTLGKTRPDGTHATGASRNGCNGVPFGVPNNRPDKTELSRAVSLCILQETPSVSLLFEAVLHGK